ncbi:MAG: translation initiation factor IF-2 [Candidatus Taylorbacteria bacterium]|nr:translation initiation factor IF-2 [Candidatus Taylorbacteria bacterium]
MNALHKKTVKEAVTPRPPVVAVMGHIDHGKTTLLDYIRQCCAISAEKRHRNAAAGEAGGITQHVSAYEVSRTTAEGKIKLITFLDTPGHEAFAGIRSRGARIADIGVLVVSAEDGVKPQTLEALKFIKESKTPFIVALTKIDKPAANIERAKQSLLEHEIYIEGYGGEIPSVPVSGLSGAGVGDLLDMILLVADVENICGRKDKPAEGVVLEAARSKEKGLSATLIVKDGTLKKGMAIVAGEAVSSLRVMQNFLGEEISSAGPGTPVAVLGWDSMPETGSPFLSFATKKEAEKYLAAARAVPPKRPHMTKNRSEERIAVPIVVKTDVSGSLEAIEYELRKLATDKVFPKIIHTGTGDVNESDVKIASSGTGAHILGFNVKIDNAAKSLSERDGIEVQIFEVIYKLVERAREILLERTPKIEVVETRGKAKIIRLFSVVKDRQVIGGKVIEGLVRTGDEFKIIRRGAEVGTGKIRELQQQKVKTDEVVKDREFGAMAEARIEIAPGDVIESFVIVKK